jgi:hypothetical protein
MRNLIFFLLLAGCSTQTAYRPVTVEVPVPVPCKVPVVLHPVWPTQELAEKSTLLEQVKALLAENELRQAYEVQLEASVKACQ